MPEPLTRLIGRDLELAEVCRYLAGSRLVTLSGAGGVGKTRLAIEAAHRTAQHLADGAAFVELASLEEETLLPRSVARTLGVGEDPNTPLIETLTRFLHDQETLALFRRTGDPGGELLTLGNLGMCSLLQNNGPPAILYSRQALSLCRQLKRPEAEGLYLPTLGAAVELQGDIAGARDCFLQALHVSLRLGDKRTMAATPETIAAHYLRREEDQLAARYYGCTDTSYESIALCRPEQEQRNRQEAFALLRNRMGNEVFEAYFASGQRLAMEEPAREAVSGEPDGRALPFGPA